MSSGRVVLGLLLSAGSTIAVLGQQDCNSSEWVSNSWCKRGAQCTPCVRFLYNLQPCAGAWCTEFPRRVMSAQLPMCLVLDSTYPPHFLRYGGRTQKIQRCGDLYFPRSISGRISAVQHVPGRASAAGKIRPVSVVSE